VNVSRLACKIQNYAWGSRSFLAALQGRSTPTQEPEAELWIGAHPALPAEAVQGDAHHRLDELIARNQNALLGEDVTRRFDGELPFLLKVLAAAEPLSLQAHPSTTQAIAGFAAEEAQGIPLGAAHRSYKDRRHKPELIVALTPFEALTGFRRVERTRELFAELGSPMLSELCSPLTSERPEEALKSVFERLMTAEPAKQAALVHETLAAAARALGGSCHFAREFAWLERLNALYPDDIGVVSSLLLNLVELEPLQALYLPAGNLHAYLDGCGVEIMASSDNVLRGGLTPKAVNVPELLRVLEFRELDVQPLAAVAADPGEHVYPTSAAEFQLSYLDVDGQGLLTNRQGPELLLVSEGHVCVSGKGSPLLLRQGDAAFVPASEGPLTLSEKGRVFRARVPL